MNLTCQNVICQRLQRSESIAGIETPNYYGVFVRLSSCKQYQNLTLIDIIKLYSNRIGIYSFMDDQILLTRSLWTSLPNIDCM